MRNLTVLVNRFRRLKERKKELGKKLSDVKEELDDTEEVLARSLAAGGLDGIRTGNRTLELSEKSRLNVEADKEKTKKWLAGSGRFDCLQLCYPRLLSLVEKGSGHEEPLHPSLRGLFSLETSPSISDHKTKTNEREKYKEVEEWTSGAVGQGKRPAKERQNNLFDEDE